MLGSSLCQLYNRDNKVFALHRNNKCFTVCNEDYSFDSSPSVIEVDFDLVLNNLNLSVLNGKVIQIWGFCVLDKSNTTNFDVPNYKSGALNIVDSFKQGHAYAINNVELIITINHHRRWICVGDPSVKDNGVEFMKNCIAVINENGQLVALWIKPNNWPKSLA